MNEGNDLTTLWANTVGIYTDRDPFHPDTFLKSPAAPKLRMLFDGIEYEREQDSRESAFAYLIVHSETMPASYTKNDPWFIACNRSALGDNLWEVTVHFEALRKVRGEHHDAAMSIIQEVRNRSQQNITNVLTMVHHPEIPVVVTTKEEPEPVLVPVKPEDEMILKL